VFDEYYLSNKINDAGPVAHVFGAPGKPRTLALTLRRNF
jgi:hypothetical protein